MRAGWNYDVYRNGKSFDPTVDQMKDPRAYASHCFLPNEENFTIRPCSDRREKKWEGIWHLPVVRVDDVGVWNFAVDVDQYVWYVFRTFVSMIQVNDNLRVDVMLFLR